MDDYSDCYKTAELINKLYEYSMSGGNCHIVTDDWNIEDSHIEWCLTVAIPENMHNYPPEQLELESEILKLMLDMDEDQRVMTLQSFEMMN